eukprot:scaffold145759_cov19-Tisochrysis_lutea.AAC.1
MDESNTRKRQKRQKGMHSESKIATVEAVNTNITEACVAGANMTNKGMHSCSLEVECGCHHASVSQNLDAPWFACPTKSTKAALNQMSAGGHVCSVPENAPGKCKRQHRTNTHTHTDFTSTPAVEAPTHGATQHGCEHPWCTTYSATRQQHQQYMTHQAAPW